MIYGTQKDRKLFVGTEEVCLTGAEERWGLRQGGGEQSVGNA